MLGLGATSLAASRAGALPEEKPAEKEPSNQVPDGFLRIEAMFPDGNPVVGAHVHAIPHLPEYGWEKTISKQTIGETDRNGVAVILMPKCAVFHLAAMELHSAVYTRIENLQRPVSGGMTIQMMMQRETNFV